MATINEHSGVITVTSSATPNVFGAWQVLIVSALRDTTYTLLFVAPTEFSQGVDTYIDLGIGDPGSEVVIAAGLWMPNRSPSIYGDPYYSIGIPLSFRVGDRISARMQDEKAFTRTYGVDIRNFV